MPNFLHRSFSIFCLSRFPALCDSDCGSNRGILKSVFQKGRDLPCKGVPHFLESRSRRMAGSVQTVVTRITKRLAPSKFAQHGSGAGQNLHNRRHSNISREIKGIWSCSIRTAFFCPREKDCVENGIDVFGSGLLKGTLLGCGCEDFKC